MIKHVKSLSLVLFLAAFVAAIFTYALVQHVRELTLFSYDPADVRFFQVLIGVFLVIALWSALAGAALLMRLPWSRPLIMTLAYVMLLNVPIGTAFGLYAIWVLRNAEVRMVLSGA